MQRRKTGCREGDLLSIPLRSHGFALGLVAATGEGGIALGYFFPLINRKTPTPDAITGLKPEDAVLVAIFGDLGLIKGEWKIIGHLKGYCSDSWPIPPFVRWDIASQEPSRIIYAKSNLLTELRIEPCSRKEANEIHRDGLFGYGAVELTLTKLLERGTTNSDESKHHG